MPEIVLHQWEMSPFCNKVRRCLAFKQMSYRVVDYNGLLARKAASLSPVGKLPVLDYAGDRVQDSSRIAELLDQRQPEPRLYPADRVLLAKARIWEDWAGQSLYFHEIYFRMLDPVSLERGLDLVCKGRPRWERAVLKAVFRRRYPKKLAQQGLARLPRAEVERLFFSLLADLDALLASQAWLCGEACCIADLAVVAQLDELIRTSDLAPRVLALPALKAWLERCNAVAPERVPA
ncbi:MAG TPA: glutathione S-transferase family protein [Solimonas sp.]|nr:glutathione S-transferase family protein [Solimonas sp.]